MLLVLFFCNHTMQESYFSPSGKISWRRSVYSIYITKTASLDASTIFRYICTKPKRHVLHSRGGGTYLSPPSLNANLLHALNKAVTTGLPLYSVTLVSIVKIQSEQIKSAWTKLNFLCSFYLFFLFFFFSFSFSFSFSFFFWWWLDGNLLPF